MNATSTRTGHHPRPNMPAFGTFGQHQGSASLLLEKANPGLRKSTPDSEALASSDDEPDQMKAASTASQKSMRNGRRTSWLNDVSASNTNRKPSFSGLYSPTTSHPGTPGSEQPSWNTMGSSGTTAWSGGGTSYAWGSIWSQDNRKEPPSRLQEVLPTTADGGIPFSIPLKPTPKTYRSQSYSVGQLDTSSSIPQQMTASTAIDGPRGRAGSQYPSLQHRTSRTGGLGGVESGGLGRLREVDDDDEEDMHNYQQNDMLANSQARMIEHLERENAQLRHAAQNRDAVYSAGSDSPQASTTGFRTSRLHDVVPEETEKVIEENEDLIGLVALSRDHNMRHLGDQQTMFYERPPLSAVENRALENVKKAHWQTSLGFGSIPEAPQSRRHSFADVPTRQDSFSSNDREEDVSSYEPGNKEVSQPDDPAYFNTTESTRRAAEARVQQSYVSPNIYPHQAHIGAYLGPASQPLFIVNFKCCRSDVFYIQEGTGLHVNVGDLVIVEADRGTDLGAVQHTNVAWDDARRFKEYYAEEHYKWLMMFSQQSRNGGPNVVNPNGLPGKPGSAVGGMGPQGHHGPHETSHTELKPKMIKRLAQHHEKQALKDKEGNEAKAKRVCQQKVLEHRLNMEILDAEFQMDSKKLTFYYFADTYINFNSLVTDLFKIYKTRIWMSAINPASFQTPTSSLGLTPAYGATSPTTGQDGPGVRRRQYPPSHQQIQPLYSDNFEPERPFPEQGPGLRTQFFGQYQGMAPQNQQSSPTTGGYPGNIHPQMDPFSPFYTQPYQMLNPNAPNFASNRPDFRARASNQSPEAWTGRFQGLSLGS